MFMWVGPQGVSSITGIDTISFKIELIEVRVLVIGVVVVLVLVKIILSVYCVFPAILRIL